MPVDELLGPPALRKQLRVMTGICTGFQPGSSGLAPDGTSRWTHRTRAVEEIDATEDPLGWPPVAAQTALPMRRSRRPEATTRGDASLSASSIQDTPNPTPGGRR